MGELTVGVPTDLLDVMGERNGREQGGIYKFQGKGEDK